ncbi:hypothetical protein BDV97DRAFT_364856 [Delphinella strobiligena]|nr:hypothetical protein BDV97DRAFT_364856 [Delphinella strobiligena]
MSWILRTNSVFLQAEHEHQGHLGSCNSSSIRDKLWTLCSGNRKDPHQKVVWPHRDIQESVSESRAPKSKVCFSCERYSTHICLDRRRNDR